MPDFAGATPLHICCAAKFHNDGILKIAKALLRAEADANKQDRFGATPLLLATYGQNFALGHLLLMYGANGCLSVLGLDLNASPSRLSRNLDGGRLRLRLVDKDQRWRVTSPPPDF